VDDIVAEVSIPAYSSDISFDDFLHRNEVEIARIIDEHQQRFRYVFNRLWEDPYSFLYG